MKNYQQINPKLQQTFTTLRENGIFPAASGKILQYILIYFAHINAMKSFSNWTTFCKVVKKRFKHLPLYRQTDCRHYNQALTGKIFQHRLFDFIHTNAMKPFSNWTTFYKVLEKRFKHLPLQPETDHRRGNFSVILI